MGLLFDSLVLLVKTLEAFMVPTSRIALHTRTTLHGTPQGKVKTNATCGPDHKGAKKRANSKNPRAVLPAVHQSCLEVNRLGADRLKLANEPHRHLTFRGDGPSCTLQLDGQESGPEPYRR